MIKPEQVPKEVIVELLAWLNSCDCEDCMSVAIAAALNAWPNHNIVDDDVVYVDRAIMLPLPQEDGDG